MTGRRRGAAADKALFELPAGRRGRVESAVNAAVRAARAESTIGELDAGLVTLARAQARAVDLAEAAREVWALARIGGELRESLIRLRLDPTSRGVGRDSSVADFLASIAGPAAPGPLPAGPTPADPPGAAAVGDTAQPA
jgi:hypothetical protein